MPLAWAGKLAIRRLGAQWRSLLTIIAGVLLAASVGALIPLYMTAVAQVSLVERLNNQLPPNETNAAASVALIPSALPLDQTLRHAEDHLDADVRALAERSLTQTFPGWLNRIVFYGETSALAIDPPAVIDDEGEARIPDPVARVFLAYHEDWPAAVSLIAGRMPQEPPLGPGMDVEIVVPFEAQTALGVNAGDVLDLDQGGPRGGWPTSRNIRAQVVGIVNAPETLSPLERAYFMSPSPLRFTETGGEYKAEFAVLAERAAFERVAAGFIPDTPVRVGWRFLFDHTRLAFSRSPDARAALLDFQDALTALFRNTDNADLQPTYSTRLIDFQTSGGQAQDQGILIDYEQSVRSLDAPFGLLLLQVGALVLFYLVVTAALVRRGERREIAMLQSRGANDASLLLERGLEAALICVGAAAFAPVLSQQMIILVTPFFARYRDLPLLLTPQAFLFAGVMAAVAFIALISTLRPVLRLPLISAGGAASRSERQPWWQRYYLDVALVALGALALLRLVGRDTPLFSTSAGGAASDPFLLLAPALLFLGLGSVLLRLFPALAAGAARLLAAGRGLLGPLATWQLSREPLHYGRITFLLALAIGIGWFATSFRATVSRSQTDQAQYRAGTDVRVTERDLRLNASRARPREAYTALPGVEAASVAWRRPGVNFQPDPTRAAIPTTILAVDSATFPGAVYWREDLGELGLPGAPDNALPERGAELPFAPASLGLWARFDVPGPFGPHIADLDRLRNRTTIYARLLDANGTWLIAPFTLRQIEYADTGAQQPGLGGGGAFVANGWAYFQANFVRESYQPAEPVRLVSLFWSHRGRGQGGERRLQLTLAGLNATAPDGTRQPLDLLTRGGWEFAYDSGALSVGGVSPSMGDSRRGRGLVAAWDQSAESGRMGLLLDYPAPPPLITLPSAGLLGQLGVAPGQPLELRAVDGVRLSVTLAAPVQRFYPSLYDAVQENGGWASTSGSQAFAIFDRDALLYALNRRPGAALYADEVWLKAAPGADPLAILDAARPADRSAAFTRAITLPGALEQLQTDPLNRGLLGLMLLAFIIAIALSVVGLLTYAALTAAARRAEFGVLRALGLSSWRVVVQLTIEQLFVIVLALVLGAALGALLSSQVVPRLALDASGARVTPPFIVQVETDALAQYGLLIGVVLALVLAFSLVIVRQLSLSRTLRLGED